MAASLGELVITLSANIARLADDLSKAEQHTKRTADAIEGSMGRVKTAFGVLTAGLSVAAIAHWAEKSLEAADATYKLSQKTGIMVEELSKLSYAAKLSGVDQDGLGKGIKKLSTEMIAAGDATSKSGKLLSALGVDLTKGINPAITKLADSFIKLPDGPTKAALAVELFGKAGMDLIPLLNQGSAGIEKMQHEAERLGLVLTTEGAKAAEEFNGNLRAVKSGSEALGVALLNTLAPSLTRISGAMKEAAIDGGIFKALLVGFGGVISEAFGMNASEAEKSHARIKKLISDLGELRETEKAMADNPAYASRLRFVQERIALLEYELRLTKSLAAAEAGAFDDQVSRAARAGNALKASGPDADFEARLKKLLVTQKELSKEGAHYITGLEKELLATGDLYIVDKKYQQVLVDIERMKKEGVPIDEKRAKQLAEEIDGARRLAEANAFVTAERKKDIEAIAQQGEAIADMVNDLDQEAENLENELRLMTLGDNARQKEILQRRMLADLTAAGDNAAAIRDITASYERMFTALDKIENLKGLQGALKQSVDLVGELAVGFAHGVKEGIQNARSMLARFRDELIAMAAKKIFLQFVAGMAGGTGIGDSAASMAGQVGQNTLTGMASSWLGQQATNYLGSGIAGATGGSIFGSGVLTGAGDFVGTGLAGLAGEAALAAGATDAFAASIAAAVPVIGWIVAIAALLYTFFGHKGGGPKEEGSFAGTFDSQGNLLVALDSNSITRIASGAHPAEAQAFVQMIASGFASSLQALGGTSSDLIFGGGFSQDPAGNAPSFVHAIVSDSSGKPLFQGFNDNVGRSPEELQAALSLEGKRAILAALQHSDLPPAIAAILNSVDALKVSMEELDAVMAKAFEMANVMRGLAALDLTGLTVESLKLMARQGETIGQTFTRVAGTIGAFNDALMTDAQKLAISRQTLTAGFDSLGLAVPKNRQEFLALVKGIDYSTESGRKLYDTLVALYPAFDAVAQAADRSHTAFMGIQDLLDQLNGVTSETKLAQLAAQFGATNSAFGGFSASQLIEVFKGMTEEQFGLFDEATQELIKAILSLAVSMKDNTSAVVQSSTIDPAYSTPQEQWVAALQKSFSDHYSNLINQQPTYLDKFTLEQTLIADQIGTWTDRAKQLEQQYAGYQLPPEYYALLTMIQNFADKIGGEYYAGWGQTGQGGTATITNGDWQNPTYTGSLEADIAKLLALEAEFGEQKGEQLFDLDKWFEGMKTQIGGNADALENLEQLYAHKRLAILAEAGQAGVDELARIKESILQWRDSLLLSNLSPLTATQRFTQAASNYSDILARAQGGDIEALRQYQAAGAAFLQEALSYFGRASTQYEAIFDQVLLDSSALGGDTAFVPPSAQDITGVRDAIIDENAKLRLLLAQLIQGMGEIAVATQQGTKTLDDALRELGDTLNQAKEITG